MRSMVSGTAATAASAGHGAASCATGRDNRPSRVSARTVGGVPVIDRGSAALAAVAALCILVGCDASTPEPEPAVVPRTATLADLTGPWLAEPLVLDLGTWGRAEAACLRDMQIAPGPRAVVIDARGAGVLSVRLAGAASSGNCDALQIKHDGTIVGAGAGWSGPGPRQQAAPALKLVLEQQSRIEGGDLAVKGFSVLGEAGPGIAAVVVEPLLGRGLVRATLMNGWFAAWWPALAGPKGRHSRVRRDRGPGRHHSALMREGAIRST